MAPPSDFERMFDLISRLQQRYPDGSATKRTLDSMMDQVLSGNARPGQFEGLQAFDDTKEEQQKEALDD
jgi:hypothetical protein